MIDMGERELRQKQDQACQVRCSHFAILLRAYGNLIYLIMVYVDHRRNMLSRLWTNSIYLRAPMIDDGCRMRPRSTGRPCDKCTRKQVVRPCKFREHVCFAMGRPDCPLQGAGLAHHRHGLLSLPRVSRPKQVLQDLLQHQPCA